MAMSKLKIMRPAIACLLLLLLIVLIVQDQVAADVGDGASSSSDPQVRGRSLAPKKLDCPNTCFGRCGKNWKNEMCNKMCNICCNKCSCVPPGTGQETRHMCPCYDKMTNPKTGKLKCP